VVMHGVGLDFKLFGNTAKKFSFSLDHGVRKESISRTANGAGSRNHVAKHTINKVD
jgi:hypothetical protein